MTAEETRLDRHRSLIDQIGDAFIESDKVLDDMYQKVTPDRYRDAFVILVSVETRIADEDLEC